MIIQILCLGLLGTCLVLSCWGNIPLLVFEAFGEASVVITSNFPHPPLLTQPVVQSNDSGTVFPSSLTLQGHSPTQQVGNPHSCTRKQIPGVLQVLKMSISAPFMTEFKTIHCCVCLHLQKHRQDTGYRVEHLQLPPGWNLASFPPLNPTDEFKPA